MGLLMGLPGIAAARSAAVSGLTARGILSKKARLGLSAATLEEGVLLGVLEPVGYGSSSNGRVRQV